MSTDLAELDAWEQAARVRRGEVTPAELVEEAIARIERIDPKIHALVSPLFDEARAAARAPLPDGPFRGVPFLMKDLGATQQGQPYYAGNRALRDARYRAPHDTYLGARFRRAGLIALGKTNTPEFGLQSTTQPLAFGPTRNPWDLERSSGGSSGGSAAAVAAGLVTFAHANDGAGSIRIPAAWCGVVGLKPSRGRVPVEPTSIGRSFAGFGITRSVRDAAALLDAVHGHEPGDLYRVPPPQRPYAEELGADPGSLRVGLLTRAPGAVVHDDCRAGAESAAKLLESLGHRVEPDGPPALFEEDRGLRTWVLGTLEYRMCLRGLAQALGRAVTPDDVEPFLWRVADPEGPVIPAEDFLEAAEWQQGWATRVASWWAGGFDLLLTPTVCEPPPYLEELALGDRPFELLDRLGPHMAFTEPFNVTGQPALTLPLHQSPDGLPIGVQLVARVGREDLLFRVASQLEAARPWSGRRPPVHA
ncbi:MAG TPA: amidase [Myxococcota bacterium]|nr:amidase [Myxococcota bacterium]